MSRVNLLDFDRTGLGHYLASLGEKPFRATQTFRWLHQRGASSLSDMTDLAASLRTRLADVASIEAPTILRESRASDGVIKWLFDAGGGNAVESVFIPESERATLCISSQAGCAVNCAFCATGHQGFARNLHTGEILAQVRHAEFSLRRERHTDARIISNVVLMGMGEPLLNYAAVLPALHALLDDHGYGLSRRRVTVSTSGVVPFIHKLARDCPVALAVSLHAPDDALRDELVPLNRKYPLRELLGACEDYLAYAPRDFITFEYCLLRGVNDSPRHARALVALLRGFPAKINAIPYNPFGAGRFQTPSQTAMRAFMDELHQAGLVATLRKTRGEDIDAACGQLAGAVKDRLSQRAGSTLQPDKAATEQPPASDGATTEVKLDRSVQIHRLQQRPGRKLVASTEATTTRLTHNARGSSAALGSALGTPLGVPLATALSPALSPALTPVLSPAAERS